MINPSEFSIKYKGKLKSYSDIPSLKTLSSMCLHQDAVSFFEKRRWPGIQDIGLQHRTAMKGLHRVMLPDAPAK